MSALQWAVGLELFLLSADPWRVVLSTDHPERRLVPLVSGADPAPHGPDRARRAAQAGEPQAPRRERAGGRARPRVHAERDRDHHAGRAGAPARASRTRATSAPGADADVTIYSRDPDLATMFSTPRYVIKDGAGDRRGGPAPAGARRAAGCAWRPGTTTRCCPTCGGISSAYSSVSFDNYPVQRLPGEPVARDEAAMNIRGVFIEETFAEAFTMRVARVIITGRSPRWAREAALKLTGFATSVIGCKVRGGDRARAARGRDARRAARRQRAVDDDGQGRSRQAPHRADRPDGAHLPDDRLLRRAAGRARPASAWARRSGSSATAFRRARSSAASGSGGSR